MAMLLYGVLSSVGSDLTHAPGFFPFSLFLKKKQNKKTLLNDIMSLSIVELGVAEGNVA
jgi:hypothetical protein